MDYVPCNYFYSISRTNKVLHTMDITLVSYQISKNLNLVFDITPYFIIFSNFQIITSNTITTFLIDNIDIL